MTVGDLTTVQELAREVIGRADVVNRDSRYVVGIAGPPGAGKSTLAVLLRDAINQESGRKLAEIAPMDGYHFPNATLEAQRKMARKGEPDTFDVIGFVRQLTLLSGAANAEVVPWPTYDREKHDPVSGVLVFDNDTRIAITEGNYLLLDNQDGWSAVQKLLDEAWYLDASTDVIKERLLARQLASGKAMPEALAKVTGSDLRNAALVASGRDRADLVLRERDGNYYEVKPYDKSTSSR